MIAGSVVTYHIRVTNHGSDDAADVVEGDKLPSGAVPVSVHADVGKMSGRRAGDHLPARHPQAGAEAHVTVVARSGGQSSALTNRVVVGTATYDPVLANNVAHATVRVHSPSPPAVTG